LLTLKTDFIEKVSERKVCIISLIMGGLSLSSGSIRASMEHYMRRFLTNLAGFEEKIMFVVLFDNPTCKSSIETQKLEV